MRITTHEQRCREIADWAVFGWIGPQQNELIQPQDTKVCVECGAEYTGNKRSKVCSYECKVRRDGRAAHERMKRLRAQRRANG